MGLKWVQKCIQISSICAMEVQQKICGNVKGNNKTCLSDTPPLSF